MSELAVTRRHASVLRSLDGSTLQIDDKSRLIVTVNVHKQDRVLWLE
jgi:hypothetical protein